MGKKNGYDGNSNELEVLAFKAHDINEVEYPETSRLINLFLVMEDEMKDYSHLADRLMQADVTKLMPSVVVNLVKRIYEQDIEFDNAMAANNLASLYYGGRVGGKPDYEQAAKYYEIADRLGYSLATENLAYIYYYGLGTDVDYEKAYLFFSKATLSGRYEAMYKLGDMFRFGYYVEKNEHMTAFCYTRAAEMLQNENEAYIKCFGSAYHRLADMYYEGIGVDIDLKNALHFYQMAEVNYYKQIEDGDKYHTNQIKVVIERQKKLRRMLRNSLPTFKY